MPGDCVANAFEDVNPAGPPRSEATSLRYSAPSWSATEGIGWPPTIFVARGSDNVSSKIEQGPIGAGRTHQADAERLSGEERQRKTDRRKSGNSGHTILSV